MILVGSDYRLCKRVMSFKALEDFTDIGLYTVRLFKNQKQNYFVTLDDRLPSIISPNGERIPLFTRSPDKLDFWFCFIEKAYAKLNQNYHILNYRNLRQCVLDLTGIDP